MDFIVVVGGDPPASSVGTHLPYPAFVIAADSGYDHASALGLTVDLVVGDLDSISDSGVDEIARHGITVEQHPADKDATDGQLALRAALDRGATAVTVVTGGSLRRLDHLLALIGLLAGPLLNDVKASAWIGPNRVDVVRGGQPLSWISEGNETVSLVPLHGRANGVSIIGARWPLSDAVLDAASTIGVSNVATGGPCRVSLRAGALLVIRPDERP